MCISLLRREIILPNLIWNVFGSSDFLLRFLNNNSTPRLISGSELFSLLLASPFPFVMIILPCILQDAIQIVSYFSCFWFRDMTISFTKLFMHLIRSTFKVIIKIHYYITDV